MMNGKIIDGRYEIIEETGRGGMAIVYRAKCMVLNRYVAIKVLRPEFREDAEFIKRFKIEAQSAGGLTHPNIVSVYDVGHEDDLEYIVMEYVEGITLKQYLNTKGQLQWKEAVDYASQICSGLEHAHKKGIVHKDIKPENIMITKEGILKITDFGIAKALTPATVATGGLTMGSVHYFSPEQARGGFVDAKTDLYSLGVLTYEMITGRLPFEGESAISVAMQHLEKDPVPPSVFNPSMPKSLEAVILKAMKKELSERYQSATQMLIDLKKVYVGSEVRYDSEEKYTQKFTPITHTPDGVKRPASQGAARKPQGTKTPSRANAANAKKKKKKKDTLGIIAGILSGIAIVALIFVAINFMTGGSDNEIECPELVNCTYAEALELIEGTKLKIVANDKEEISEDDKRIIIDQNPKSGKTIKKNATITIKFGEEPAKLIKVPKITNMTETNATSALIAAGFEVSVEMQKSEEISEGRVITSKPAPGTEVSEGSVITIYISEGKEEDEYTLVPNLLGKTKEEAEILLENANLKLGEVQKVNSSKEEGTIVGQSEAEGNRVKKDKAISIRISNGKDASSSSAPSSEPSKKPGTTTPIPGNPASGN